MLQYYIIFVVTAERQEWIPDATNQTRQKVTTNRLNSTKEFIFPHTNQLSDMDPQFEICKIPDSWTENMAHIWISQIYARTKNVA